MISGKSSYKIIVFLLLATPLLCYLEWGNHKMFLFEMEYDLFTIHDSFSVLTHPAICLPFLGQLLLVIAIFQNQPSKKLVFSGIILLGLLVALVTLSGILTLNFKIAISTLPFWIMVFICIRKHRKARKF